MTVFQTACKILQTLKDHGFIAYFAGGYVRDFLMGHPSDDIDIATNAPVSVIQSLFAKTIPVGIQFGIVVVVENSHQFEVATFRKDQGYEDGRRPISIEEASPEEDASRRDFTINGMFYDPLTNTLFDYVKGKEDLQKKVIRAIGNPHMRFLEDRLRMIRAVRYSCRFSYKIEDSTKEAIIAHANSLFPSVAIERVWQEFVKMQKFGNFKTFLLKLHQLHLLQTIFPKLAETPEEAISKALGALDHFPENAPVISQVLELFPSFHLQDKLELCKYLKLSNQEKEFVIYYEKIFLLYRSCQKELSLDLFDWAYLYAHPQFTPSLKMAIAPLSKEKREEILLEHEKKMHSLEKEIHRIQTNSPLVTSKHLMNEGVAPGISMGKLLKEAEKIAINLKITDPKKIILELKKSSFWP